jgi:hypothetical protein
MTSAPDPAVPQPGDPGTARPLILSDTRPDEKSLAALMC